MPFSLKHASTVAGVSLAIAAQLVFAPYKPALAGGTREATTQQKLPDFTVQIEQNKDGMWGVMDVMGRRMGSGFEIGPQGERVANYNVFISNTGEDGSNPYFYHMIDGEERLLLSNGDKVRELDTAAPKTAKEAMVLDTMRALADTVSEEIYDKMGAIEPADRPAIKSNAYGKPLTPKF